MSLRPGFGGGAVFEAAPDAETGILIIGAGLAGLFLALRLAPLRCTVVSPSPLGQSAASAWAQGGLAAALDPEDSPEAHAADTVAAGAGLSDPVVARLIAEEGPARVADLLALGVPFDTTPGGALALSLEAAHSRPRVARVGGDLAGRAIMTALERAVRASEHIALLENMTATGLCVRPGGGAVAGAVLQAVGGAGAASGAGAARTVLRARETVLCTGGAAALFSVTTNPPSSTGDALAMAYEAGAGVADPEFVQFHPTALDTGSDPAPLATEALRGEGARLVDAEGRPFMQDFDPRGDLAPRDVVARGVHLMGERGGAFLDCTAVMPDSFAEHFSTVFAACQAAGLDPRERAFPVAPAAHYHMGGVLSDLHGRATLPGLSVCGECASTGAHGANRLASNSLLEAVVFADRIARRLLGEAGAEPGVGAEPEPGRVEARAAPRLDGSALAGLRREMQAHCGVVRRREGLEQLLNRIGALDAAHGPARPLLAARLMAEAALARKESRGGHYRSDHPETLAEARRTFLHAPLSSPAPGPAPSEAADLPHARAR